MADVALPPMIRDGNTPENRKPRPKACTFCRSSKHRCDGEEGVMSCSRCERNLRKCTWPERKPMGRKPKNLKRPTTDAEPSPTPARAPERASSILPSNSFNSLFHSPSASSPYDDPISSPSNVNNWGLDPASILFAEGLASALNDLPTPSSQHPTLSDIISPALFASSTSPAASTPAGSGSGTSEAGSTALDTTSILSETGDPETAGKLIDVFFAIPHLYVPVLPGREEFLQDFAQQSPLLRNSVFALASTYASFPVTTDYRTLAIGQLEAVNPDIMEPFSNDAIQYMQALLLMVFLEFGKGNVPFSVDLMKRACSFTVQKGWNSFDSSPAETSAFEFTVNRDGPLMRRVGSNNTVVDHSMARLIRIIFWECWTCDVVMSVTCRQQRNFHGVAVTVSLPAAPALYREPGCPIVWHYPLRVRVLTIMVEAIGFPACQDANQRQQHAERFFTFDTLIDNLMMEAHLAWADCQKVLTGYSGRLAGTPLGQEAAVGNELYYMAILMLHSAAIHLHHLYAMPEVNFDLKVCGITTGFALLELQQTNADSDYTQNVFQPSLGKIVNASRALMGMMRSAHQSTVLSITQHSLPSMGLSVHIPRRVSPVTQEPTAVMEDILRHSPFCGCSQVVAAFGAALEVATASNKWQAMTAESNFETSKMVLQRVKRVWPVAAVFEDELEKCHGAVQGALQLW